MIGYNYLRPHKRETNPAHWPAVHIKIEKACTELFNLHGQFEYRRGEPTRRAKKVYKDLEAIADKHGLKRSHLWNVFFGMV